MIPWRGADSDHVRFYPIAHRRRRNSFGGRGLARNVARGEVRRVLHELEPGVPLINVRSLSEHVESNLFLRRIPRGCLPSRPLLSSLQRFGIYSASQQRAHRIHRDRRAHGSGRNCGRCGIANRGETMRVMPRRGRTIADRVHSFTSTLCPGPARPRVFLGTGHPVSRRDCGMRCPPDERGPRPMLA